VLLANQLVADGQTSAAAGLLDRILQSRGNSRDVILSALEARADVAVRLKQDAVAVEAFRRAIVIQSGYRPPEEAGAKVLDAFRKAQSALQGTPPMRVTHVPIAQINKHEPMKVGVTIASDPLQMIERVEVRYRLEGGGVFTPSSVTVSPGTKNVTVEVPASFVARLRGNTKIEYYVVAQDALESTYASLGTKEQPYIAVVTPDAGEIGVGMPQKPVYKRGWFWGTLVTVAAAVGAGIGLGVYFGTLNNPPTINFTSR
jgi:hypothetical protein